MKKTFFPLLAVLLLAGCSHRYVITTSNGSTIDTTTKPRLKNGFYVYKDALGRDQMVHSGRVSEIAPASMARKEKDNFNFTPSK
jgi:Bacterial protein of unknown function (DUF903)/Prokaryotic membrane lipoprotein lipid attachment site